MTNTTNHNPSLRIELFVQDVSAAADFYGRVLGFEIGPRQADGYTPMQYGSVRLSLNRHDGLPADHPVYATPDERLGRGVEFVLEVDNLNALYERVQSQGWPLSNPLTTQPWGLTDFRIADPDGYYWRITTL